MAGKKLAQAKKALQFCVENLNDGDRFEIIRFATETESLFDKLVDASAENRSRATEFISALKPIGGTAIDAALRKALTLHPPKEDRPFVVIFLTDGLPTVGKTDENQIVDSVVKASESNIRVFCFGIGTDVNTAFARPNRRIHQGIQPVRPARGRHRGQSFEFLHQNQRTGAGQCFHHFSARHAGHGNFSITAARSFQR
jgi:secreted protein with Ig-like and vWFA domain